jgi:hypothetical protein
MPNLPRPAKKTPPDLGSTHCGKAATFAEKIIKKMKKQGTYNYDTVFVKYKILNNEYGKLAKQFIDDLVPSPRGIGSVDANGVVGDDYQLISVDLIRKETMS